MSQKIAQSYLRRHLSKERSHCQATRRTALFSVAQLVDFGSEKIKVVSSEGTGRGYKNEMLSKMFGKYALSHSILHSSVEIIPINDWPLFNKVST